MPTYRHIKRCVRDWIVTARDAPQIIHVDPYTFRALVREGYIQQTARKGCYRLGSIIDGYAEAVRMARIKPPHARGQNPVAMTCEVGDIKALQPNFT